MTENGPPDLTVLQLVNRIDVPDGADVGVSILGGKRGDGQDFVVVMLVGRPGMESLARAQAEAMLGIRIQDGGPPSEH